MNDIKKKKRTARQSRAMHLWFELVSDEFRAAGYDMKQILAKDIAIPATPQLIKECMWRVTQDAMYSKNSTTELTTAETTKVYEVLNRHLGEKFGIHIPWPSTEEQMLQDLTS